MKLAVNYSLAGKCFITLTTWFLTTIISAQSINELDTWSTIGIKWKAMKKFTLQADTHLKSIEFYHHFYHIDLKLNAYYDLNEWITINGGAGRYTIFTKGGDFIDPILQKETRFWEGIFLEKSISRLIFENRIVLEQRFLLDEYMNRMRLRFGLKIPFNNPNLISKTLFASSYDDVFIVERIQINRFFAGLGYETDFGTFQAGWMHQTRYILDMKEYLNALSVTMIFEIRNKNI